jgi:DMSO/TMAO reductase YedYZ molybdopterin-dependent catalytic subunit
MIESPHDPTGLVVIRQAPFNAESPPAALERELTPAAQVYVRSNFATPALPGDDHRIAVGGVVREPFAITVGELRALSRATATVTMECAGNDRLSMRPLPPGELWRSGAVSTARWTGVPLRALLERAGVASDAVEILVEGADRGQVDDEPGVVAFARSLPLADALDPRVLLALEMNDAPLTPAHGAPVRLVVPGWYGMASVKWVARVEALARPFAGRFQARRYVYDDGAGGVRPVTRMRVKSAIVAPADGAVLPPGRVTVRGWAWSGDGDIARVEVDAGAGWQEARLGAPASAHAWTPWATEVELAAAGRYALRSRAHDAAGNVQPEVPPWNRLGYGNNAVRPVLVDVA